MKVNINRQKRNVLFKIVKPLVIGLLISLSLSSCENDMRCHINFREKQLTLSSYDLPYKSGNWNHPDYSKPFTSLGNHRIEIQLNDPGREWVQVKVPWRRRDENPEEKEVIIVDADSGQTADELICLDINNEFGHFIFKPNPASRRYFMYYLPHESSGSYYPRLNYTTMGKKEKVPSNAISPAQLQNMPYAEVLSAQSIDNFHSFFPMEIIATHEEVAKYTELIPRAYYTFPEYRDRLVKMNDYLPLHWVMDTTIVNGLADTVFRGEYYSFQVGLYAHLEDLEEVQVTFTDLKGVRGEIDKRNLTCFNTGGIDLNGHSFEQMVNVDSSMVHALWFGLDVPKRTKASSYFGEIYIQPKGRTVDTIYLDLTVLPDTLANSGDDNGQNMSRLRWLNSTLGMDENFIVEPFVQVQVVDKKIQIIGRTLDLDTYGLPQQISSYFTQEMTGMGEIENFILSGPIDFEILGNNTYPITWHTSPFEIEQTHPGEAHWTTVNTSEDFTVKLRGRIEYDGMLQYRMIVFANEDTEVRDILLKIPMKKDAAQYMLGLGFKGGKFSENIKWKWDVTKHQEGAWFGAINKGLAFVLRDHTYERPLNTNFYQAQPLKMPHSWYNEGKGGIDIAVEGDELRIRNYSGPRNIAKGDSLIFDIRFLVTPFKPFDTKTHFTTRFVHKYVPVDSVVAWKGTIVNVHHANEINPYINYPFYNIEQQKAYIDEAHRKGIKVKLYNTIRELSYKAHELFAFRSLGYEILNDGEGGGHSWLQEHLKDHYHSAWHATRVNDAAILNKGNSRWTNYYIEGINWLARQQDIDGLYLDDIAFSRSTVKRIANVLSEQRGSYVIDLHSANQFNPRDGFTNSALLYMEHFPYVSRLWFGEYFEYDLGPDYWMTEVSGIPFGLGGEMLEKGGHPYRGLLYGMTTRIYGTYNPRPIWRLFDDFDIANSKMLGYWVDKSPVKTNLPNIRSTIYKKENRILIVIGSWSGRNERVDLEIDWSLLGFEKAASRLFSPSIDGLQTYQDWNIGNPVTVKTNQGLILILEKT